MNEILLGRLKELREEKGISQRQLQRDLDLSASTITKWKTSAPKPDTLQKVADYFNVTTDYLTGRTKFRNKEHMLQSFDNNIGLKELIDGNKEIPVDYCVQTDEGIILIESMTPAPKYIEPGVRELAEKISTNPKLMKIVEVLCGLPEKKFDAIYNMMITMGEE